KGNRCPGKISTAHFSRTLSVRAARKTMYADFCRCRLRHKYVRKWDEWTYSSAKQFLDEAGREEALKIWQQYPLLDYGKGRDD
ncbi:MAG: hypothetical protein PHV82_17950, partial [Victivallaceae bacterium]|nr:hypothetical protein [Victivallaceae bacterium]